MIMIGGKPHEILLVPQSQLGEEYIGKYEEDRQRIRVADNLPLEKESETILHEVIHGIMAHMCIDQPDETDERFVESFSKGLYAFWKDNPNFFGEVIK